MDVVILGAGAHGSDLKAICKAAGINVIDTLDDHVEGYEPCRTMSRQKTTVSYLIGVNSPAARFDLDRIDHPAAVAIHPSAIVDPTFDPGPGTVVAAGAIIGNDVTTGRHVHINLGSSLIRSTIGDYSTIAPGVDVAGDVTIGKGVFIGIGSTISNLVTIGDYATVGAGSLVLEDVPPFATYVGRPAKPMVSGCGP